ncbi:MAG TPA: transposase [Thermoguttaceae bacterium]|nr:transposase [Thermoguttaceae bacterium]
MATKRNSRKNRTIGPDRLGKPNGIIQPRVQAVSPERFGIVAVDCAKARSKWMLCDFYGKVLVPPTEVEHARMHMQLATVQLKDACERHDIRDAIAAIEMTGTYHRPIQRAFRKAGVETRLVHPFASKQYRLPAHGDNKTDDHDLEGIFRAAVNGFGLLEPVWDETYLLLQLLSRHRRDLVVKRAKLQCQIRQYLERCLPGYAALFPGDDLWTRPVAIAIARHATSAEAIRQARIPGVTRWLRDEEIRFQARTVEKVIAWSGNAADADPMAEHLGRVWKALHDDWRAKTEQIRSLERQLAGILVKTPYLLLLSIPGINVVSAAELAGEMGPIEHYAHAKAVTGRAGLFPSRYQSDQVDRADGPLARMRNSRLRAAWMRVAENLIKCNAHYRGKFQFWKQRGVDSRDIRCRIANRATRPVFQMVSGRKLYRHPSCLDRSYVLDKLLTFHREHQTPPVGIVEDMHQAARQIPKEDRLAEAAPLQAIYERARRSRRRGPQPIGDLLVAVLARLGVGGLESKTEARDPIAAVSDTST